METETTSFLESIPGWSWLKAVWKLAKELWVWLVKIYKECQEEKYKKISDPIVNEVKKQLDEVRKQLDGLTKPPLVPTKYFEHSKTSNPEFDELIDNALSKGHEFIFFGESGPMMAFRLAKKEKISSKQITFFICNPFNDVLLRQQAYIRNQGSEPSEDEVLNLRYDIFVTTNILRKVNARILLYFHDELVYQRIEYMDGKGVFLSFYRGYYNAYPGTMYYSNAQQIKNGAKLYDTYSLCLLAQKSLSDKNKIDLLKHNNETEEEWWNFLQKKFKWKVTYDHERFKKRNDEHEKRWKERYGEQPKK